MRDCLILPSREGRSGLSGTWQSGFTIVELAIIVVVIGILASFLLPNFTDFSDDAKQSAVDAVASAAAAAQANNAARCKGGLSCVSVGSCASIPIDSSQLNGVTISGTAPSCTATLGTFTKNFTVVPST